MVKTNEYNEQLQKWALDRHAAAASSSDQTIASFNASVAPLPTRPHELVKITAESCQKEAEAEAKAHITKCAVWQPRTTVYLKLYEWIEKTMGRQFFSIAAAQLVAEKKANIQALVRTLKTVLHQTDTTIQTTTRQDYLQSLNTKNVRNPKVWIMQHQELIRKGNLYRVPEVLGTLGINLFLIAASNFDSSWAQKYFLETKEADELGIPPKYSLEQLARLFYSNQADRQYQQLVGGKSGHGHFSTLGSRSDNDETPDSEASDSHGQRSNRFKTKGKPTEKACPCSKDKTHHWSPLNCARLQMAVYGKVFAKYQDGTARPNPKMDDQYCNEIRQRFATLQWKALRGQMSSDKPFPQSTKDLLAKLDKQGSDKSNKGKSTFPGNLSDKGGTSGTHAHPVLLPNLAEHSAAGIYSLWNSPHPLSDSTLLDNCGATNLVNDRSMLLEGSFVKSTPEDLVECGSSQLPIIGRGTRVMKGVLKGPNGESFDLTLHDVAVVENFHVNIISEARLYKTGLWFCGMDCTLRWNEEGLPIGEHHVVRQLERRQNLVFFEYKPRSIYSPSTRDILSSAAGTVMFPTLSRRVNKPYKPFRDYKHSRIDSERVWHLRAGHLGADALRKLISTARNVKIIKVIGRIKCEQCTLTYAT
jgi:hypothetical protein